MLYELRTYTAHPGKMPALLDRFRTHTLGAFSRNGIESVGYWIDSKAPDNLVYMVRFADAESRKIAWDSFAADADWIEVRRVTEKDGQLVERAVRNLLNPTDFSPMT